MALMIFSASFGCKCVINAENPSHTQNVNAEVMDMAITKPRAVMPHNVDLSASS